MRNEYAYCKACFLTLRPIHGQDFVHFHNMRKLVWYYRIVRLGFELVNIHIMRTPLKTGQQGTSHGEYLMMIVRCVFFLSIFLYILWVLIRMTTTRAGPLLATLPWGIFFLHHSVHFPIHCHNSLGKFCRDTVVILDWLQWVCFSR